MPEGTPMGWDWRDLSRANRLTVAAISLEWQNLGLSPQRRLAAGLLPLH